MCTLHIFNELPWELQLEPPRALSGSENKLSNYVNYGNMEKLQSISARSRSHSHSTLESLQSFFNLFTFLWASSNNFSPLCAHGCGCMCSVVWTNTKRLDSAEFFLSWSFSLDLYCFGCSFMQQPNKLYDMLEKSLKYGSSGAHNEKTRGKAWSLKLSQSLEVTRLTNPKAVSNAREREKINDAEEFFFSRSV